MNPEQKVDGLGIKGRSIPFPVDKSWENLARAFLLPARRTG